MIEACLVDPSAIDRATLLVSARDFYGSGASRIFARICEWRGKGRVFDLYMLDQSFENEPEYERFRDYLDSLQLITGQTATHFAKIVKEMTVRRSLVRAMQRIIDQCHNMTPDIGEIIDHIEAAVREAKNGVSLLTFWKEAL